VQLALLPVLVRYAHATISAYSFETLLVAFPVLLAGNLLSGL
jgi:hypothetical protein